MANFKGWLVKCGDTVIPNKYIQADTYKATPNQRLETDSYRDGDGVLRRPGVCSVVSSKIELNTMSLHLDEKIDLQNIINNSMSVSLERKCSITYWNDEKNEYDTGDFYVPDTTFEISTIKGTDILYKPVRICFIEYGHTL